MTSFRQHIIDNAGEYARADYEDGLNGIIVFTEDTLVDFVLDMVAEFDKRRSEDDDRGTDS